MARGPINETSSLPVAALVWSGARRTPQEFSPPTRSDGWGPFLQTLRRIASAGAGGERGPRQQHDVAGRVSQSEKFLDFRPNLGSSPTPFPRADVAGRGVRARLKPGPFQTNAKDQGRLSTT